MMGAIIMQEDTGMLLEVMKVLHICLLDMLMDQVTLEFLASITMHTKIFGTSAMAMIR